MQQFCLSFHDHIILKNQDQLLHNAFLEINFILIYFLGPIQGTWFERNRFQVWND